MIIIGLIKIRFTQFYRSAAEIGLVRMLLLSTLLSFFIFILLMQATSGVSMSYAVGAVLVIVTLIHLQRQDKLFLRTNFRQYRLVCMAEYLLLSVPLVAFLLCHFQWLLTLVLLLLLGAIVNFEIKPNQRSLNTKIQHLIPGECFEWKAGVRKYLFLITILWVLGLSTSFFVASVPIVISILGVLPLAFYEKSEPYQMITVFERSASKLLIRKVKWQVLFFSVLSVPLIAVFMIFHHDRWYVPTAEYFIFISLHTYLILTKYAFYEPNSKSSAVQVLGTLGALGVIIPVFLPVVWLLSIRFYYKSRQNLHFYLNDYD
ncbi:hypothetical protein [Pontibacter harenae]|uniref:hypothetical protein n=1 Tax=Pontibacter harenae TaxID=2894083 RepID=UPI001E4CBD01|nr:hypothetical protein [Pontibacter harenae]MCC9169145.1 hypothetical protein [Pontibacter harenae]